MRAVDEWGNPGPLGNGTAFATLPAPTFDAEPAELELRLFTGEVATVTPAGIRQCL